MSLSWGQAQSNVILFPMGSVWKYFSQGTAPSAGWTTPSYDDASWYTGPGQLGYGDGDEATVVGFGPDSYNKYITTYFRHKFVVSNPAAFASLSFRLLVDDGAAVYLNGTEVSRVNLPNTPLTNTSLAIAAVEDTIFVGSTTPTLLVSGTNVVAVEVHQNSPASSDLSFDLELSALPATPAPLMLAQRVIESSSNSVRLMAIPAGSVTNYWIEERLPSSSRPTYVSDGGIFTLTNSTIRFGPFYDNQARVLTYTVGSLVPGTCLRPGLIAGTAWANTVGAAVVGDNLIGLAAVFPADVSPKDGQVSSNEVAAYAAAWRSGAAWSIQPSPISLDFVSRAAALWQARDSYGFDPTALSSKPALRWLSYGAPYPSCLKPVSPYPSGTAECLLPGGYTPAQPLMVEITVSPFTNVLAWTAEDQLPVGWTATDLGPGGAFDATSGKVKFGPMPDALPRILTYQATPPANAKGTVAFVGSVSFDGVPAAIGGMRTLSPLPVTDPPVITLHPAGQSVMGGSTVTFSVMATGAPPLTYQWQKYASDIPYQTNTTLTIYGAQPSDAGSYRVLVTNPAGTVASDEAYLSVSLVQPPSITGDPITRGAVVGQSAEFSVSAQGEPQPTIQWYFAGLPLSGATDSLLHIEPVTAENAGPYQAVVSNIGGSVTSRVANLVVSPPGPLDHWVWRHPLPQGNDLFTVASGNGVCVAAGDIGDKVVSNDDGATWQSYPDPERSLYRIAFGNGLFTAVEDIWVPNAGYRSYIETSTNGIQWNRSEVPEFGDTIFTDIAFGNGRFVVIGDSKAAVSASGQSWTVVSPPALAGCERIFFGNGMFVAIVNRGETVTDGFVQVIAVSTDGLNWTERSLGVRSRLLGLTWGNGVYAGFGYQFFSSSVPVSYMAFVSSDLVSWTFRALPINYEGRAIAHGGNRFVMISDLAEGTILSSSNGLDWAATTVWPSNALYAITHTGNSFIAVGERGNIFTSTTGERWVARSDGTDVNLRGVACNPAGFHVATGNEGLLFTSPDGQNWTRQAPMTTNNVRGVAFGAGRFVGVGEGDTSGATIVVSTNGTQWTRLAIGSNTLSLYDVTYAQDRFVAAGSSGVMVSPDGLHWTNCYAGTSQKLNSLTWGDGRFVAVGRKSSLVTSTNGTNWAPMSKAGVTAGTFFQAVAYGNGIFVAGGQSGVIAVGTNQVWTNVIQWSSVPSPFYQDIEDMVFANGLFVAVGQNGFCASSPDGRLWTPHNTGCRNDLRSIIDAAGSLTAVGNNETIVQTGGTVVPFARRVINAGGRIQLVTSPPARTSFFAVEDQPPISWPVTNISHAGVFDARTGKVKFGPFSDAEPRLLSYTVLVPTCRPPCPGYFTGTASANGVNSPVAGDTQLTAPFPHPADTAPEDWTITIGEVTAYGAAWRQGLDWPTPPNPIPIDYVTRAGTLWRGGECYQFAAPATAPLCWILCGTNDVPGRARLASKTGAAERGTPSAYVPGEPLTVSIRVTPAGTTAAFAVEDQFPAGWVVSQISPGGNLDPQSGKVKWGPVFDTTTQTLTYRLTPPSGTTGTVALSGTASFDGTSVPIAGQFQLEAGCRLVLQGQPGSPALKLGLSGNTARPYVIETSTDLKAWQPLTTLTNPGAASFIPLPASPDDPQRFYRAVPAP